MPKGEMACESRKGSGGRICTDGLRGMNATIYYLIYPASRAVYEPNNSCIFAVASSNVSNANSLGAQ